MVKCTMTFSTKAYNSAVLEARTLELIWDVGLDQWMTLMAKVKVTVTSSTKQAYNVNAWGKDPQMS